MDMRFCLPAYVGIILQKGDTVFLIKRCNTNWASGCWNFPGGLIEAGESARDAAIRETREEVGVVVEPDAFELVHVLHVHKNESNTQDILGLYFRARSWQGAAMNNEPDKITDAGWFALDAPPHDTTEHALLAIQGLVGTSRYSESGW